MVMIKGSSLIASRELMLATHGKEGLEKTLALLSKEDREALGPSLTVVGWYPMELYIRWLEASVKVACDGDPAKIIERSVLGTAAQFKGMYKAFAELPSPESVVERLAGFTQTYLRGITASVDAVSKGRYVITHRGFAPTHRLYEYVIVGWWKHVLTTSQAKNPKVKLKASVASGPTSEIELSWDP
jgi:hypothetical protein